MSIWPDPLKSDNLILVRKRMSATEVSRNFSAVLDLVVAGDEVEITRGNRVVATVRPPAFNEDSLGKLEEILADLPKLDTQERIEQDEVWKELARQRSAPESAPRENAW